jgi:hypothetical protein
MGTETRTVSIQTMTTMVSETTGITVLHNRRIWMVTGIMMAARNRLAFEVRCCGGRLYRRIL